MELKRRSKHGTLAYVLNALARQASAAADMAGNATPENKAQINKDLDYAIRNIKLQTEMVEYHFAKAQGEA
jgi:hypothetical protein